jgi:four helix bundle protein
MESSGAVPKRINSYRDLIVWQKSMDLIEVLHPALLRLPKEELFGLNAQLRKSALSIASNISEGHDRNSRNEFLHFLGIARGSLAEVQTQIHVAGRLKYWPENQVESFLGRTYEISKMLTALMKSLKARG